jgi:hypothetical protein
MAIRKNGASKDSRTPASARAQPVQLASLAISELTPDPRNPRKHSRAQIRAIARSMEAFGFNAPILVDKNRQIIAGHGRYEAAKLIGITQVPVVSLEHLSEAQARAYMLADNKLTDRSRWDDATLAVHLKELSELAIDFDIEAIGFEAPEIDVRIQSLDAMEPADSADEFKTAAGHAVSRPGDLWVLGHHRLYCGSALDAQAYEAVLGAEKAAGVFTDPPYNVKIDGHVCGSGAIKHREFAMASGEMTEDDFINFLTETLELAWFLRNSTIAHGLRSLHHRRHSAAERIVKGVPHVGIFGQCYVATRAVQAFHSANDPNHPGSRRF